MAHRALRRRDRARSGCSRTRRGSTSIRSGRPTAPRSPTSPTAPARRTSSCTTSTTARALSAHEPRGRRVGRSPSTARRSPGRATSTAWRSRYYEDGKYTVWTVDAPATRWPARRTTPPCRGPGGRRPARRRDSTTLRAPSHAWSPWPRCSTACNSASPTPTRFRDLRTRCASCPSTSRGPASATPPTTTAATSSAARPWCSSDMLGDHRVAVSAEINGRVSEARAYVGYTNLAHRWQYTTGFAQSPFYFLTGDSVVQQRRAVVALEHQEITTYVARQVYGAHVVSVQPVRAGRARRRVQQHRPRAVVHQPRRSPTASRLAPSSSTARAAITRSTTSTRRWRYVFDNSLYAATGPIAGQRYRLQVTPVFGAYRWMEYLADYRRYDPIVFNYLTVATRLYAKCRSGTRRDGVSEVHCPTGLRARLRPQQPVLRQLSRDRRQSVQLQRPAAAGQPRRSWPTWNCASRSCANWSLGVLPFSFCRRSTASCSTTRGSPGRGGQTVYGSRPRELRSHATALSAAQLRSGLATESVQLRAHQLGLRHSARPARPPRLLDLVACGRVFKGGRWVGSGGGPRLGYRLGYQLSAIGYRYRLARLGYRLSAIGYGYRLRLSAIPLDIGKIPLGL